MNLNQPAAEISTLAPTEAQRLAQLEATIETGLATFVAVGNALIEIRDNRLYKSTHKAFEDYCREKWEMSKTHVNRIIQATEFSEMTPIGVKKATEFTVRPVLTLPKDEQVDAWEEAVRTAPQGKPTAKHVQSVVDTRKAAKTAPQPPQRPVPAAVSAPVPPPPPKPESTGPKLSILNGVPVVDPPDIAKMRASGKLSATAVVEIADPDPTEDEEEQEQGPTTPDNSELSDEDWLSALPLSASLSGPALKCFQADALAYRAIDPHRKRFAMGARVILAKEKKRVGTKGEYAFRVSRFVKLNAPQDWRACILPQDGGCGGTGDIPLLGKCVRCHGRGYTI